MALLPGPSLGTVMMAMVAVANVAIARSHSVTEFDSSEAAEVEREQGHWHHHRNARQVLSQ